MARNTLRSPSLSGARRRTVAAIIGAAALVGALLAPAAANAADPIDAVISGTVTADVGGAPLEDVTVTAENLDSGETVESVSDELGEYAITDLPAGVYYVSFAAPADSDYVSEWYLDSVSSDDSSAISLAQSEEREINAGLATGGTLSGTVTGLANAKLADVLVSVYTFDSQALLAETVTEADGLYELRGIPTTGVTVSFSDQAERGYSTVWSNNRSTQATADKITLTAAGTKQVNAALTVGSTISGSVKGPGNSTLAEGAASVILTPSSGSDDDVIDSQDIDSVGAYSFEGVAPGSYIVQFVDAAEAGFSLQWWNNATSRDAATVITVTAGQNRTGISAVLTKGASISGTVRGAGAPTVALEDATVTLFDDEANYVASGTTDATGAYSIAGLAAGTYALYFESPEGSGYTPEWYENKLDFDTATPITIAAGADLTGFSSVLAIGGSITGSVTGSDQPGVGISEVDVTAYDADGYEAGAATTNTAGVYEIAGLTAGSYKVQFQATNAPAYAPQWWSNKASFETAQVITVASGVASTGKNAVLQRGGTIAGTVTGGTPAVELESIEVTAYNESGDAVRVGFTDDTGAFLLQGIPAGKFTLGYRDAGEAPVYLEEYWNDEYSFDDATFFATTAASTISGKNATLTLGATLSGVVTGDDAPFVPLDDVLVELFTLNHDLVADTATDSEGRFQFTLLAPGTYKLSYTGPEGSEYGSEWWNNSASFPTANGIVLTAGAALTADAGLVNAPEDLDEPPVPTITGAVRVGSTITANAGTWGPAPVELSYQWNYYGEPISGATEPTYAISVDDYDAELSVTVTGGKLGYLPRSVDSESTAPVAEGVFPKVVPVISGSPVVGKTLKVLRGDWRVTGTEFSYRWKNNGKNISGATGSTYKLQKTDAGAKITVTVTGTADAYANAARTSTALTIQKIFTKQPAPKISGTAKVGKKLTAKTGTWQPSGAKFTAQWNRNGVAIPGATKSNYKLAKADRGKKITVSVTATKEGYTTRTTTSSAVKVK